MERWSVNGLNQLQVRTHLRIYASTLLLAVAGCGIGSERKDPRELQIEKFKQQEAGLTGDVQQYQAEIEQLRSQIRALSVLPQDKRVNPYELTTIQIAKISNFFDKDNDGIREKLVVYIQPIDVEGDILKAAGMIEVQLWNLNNPSNEALLGQWKVEPAELRKLWFDSLTTGYRLTFDRPEGLELLADPLTVKVTFIDYLTGESFRTQQVIKPKLD